MKKYLIIFMCVLFIGLATASISSLGTVKQNGCIDLIQVADWSNESNVTSVRLPQTNSIILSEVSMEQNGNEFNYTFCSTENIGKYIVNGFSSNGTHTVSWVYDFEVTPSGFINTLGLYIVFLIVIGGIVVLGFSIQEAWFVILGGMGFIMLGIYSINYGVVGFRDMFMTWGVGLFEIAVGAVLSIGAGIYKMDND